MPNISDNDILRVLSKALSTKEATGTPAGPYLHGPGGMFGIAGIDRDIISARVQPIGLASMLPAVPSVHESVVWIHYRVLGWYWNGTGRRL
jgi:hypothetical protein